MVHNSRSICYFVETEESADKVRRFLKTKSEKEREPSSSSAHKAMELERAKTDLATGAWKDKIVPFPIVLLIPMDVYETNVTVHRRAIPRCTCLRVRMWAYVPVGKRFFPHGSMSL